MIYGDTFDHKVVKTMADFSSAMNVALHGLYSEFWETYLAMDGTLRFNNALPYFLAPSRNYENADVKIMVCGKESNDWGHGTNEFRDISPKPLDLMNLYDFWINGNGGTENENGAYGPFMDFYAHWFKYPFENDITKDVILADKIKKSGKTIGCVASNVIKISHKGKGFNRDLNAPFMDIFGKEIDILRPNIIIATIYRKDAPDYRKVIDEKFGLDTIDLNLSTNEEYKRFQIGKCFLFLVRHPERMQNDLKKRLWEDVRLIIASEFL